MLKINSWHSKKSEEGEQRLLNLKQKHVVHSGSLVVWWHHHSTTTLKSYFKFNWATLAYVLELEKNDKLDIKALEMLNDLPSCNGWKWMKNAFP